MAGLYTHPRLHDIPLPELFTLIAQQNPRRPLVQVIKDRTGNPIDSVRFTWAGVLQHSQYAAVDLRNRWAERQDINMKYVARPREPGSPPVIVGVLAKNGYELYMNILACTLNRWTVLLISPKNSPAAIDHLLRTSHSSLFIAEPANIIAFGRTMELAIPGLVTQEIANLDQAVTGLTSSPLKPLSQDQLNTEMNLPVFYLHTSGSTGHPKIVPWSHEFLLSGIRARTRDSNDFIGLPLYCVPPIIHAAGMIVHFMYAPAQGNILNFVSASTHKPASADSLLAHLPFVRGGILILPPSILEDLLGLGPEAVEKVAKGTALVSYTGAPLNTATGNALVAAGMKLHSRYGSTEINCASTHLFPKKPEDWQYVYFRDGYELHFLPVDDDSNLRELVIGPGTDGCPATINHENPRGYATNDVWEPHPTVPNLWKHHSRKGNVTVLSNGEKSDNKQIEDLLLRDKHILFVQVFGTGRPMNGVIIQPTDPLVSTHVLLHIQSTIEHANLILPKHSKLVPELIIIASSDRLFATTDKGTVKKKETLDMYQREIERAYEILEEGGAGSEWSFNGSAREEEDLKDFLRSAVQSVLGENVPDEGDLFENGLDSLLAILLRGAVLSVVKKTPTSSQLVPHNIVYLYPSINALTTYLLSRAIPGTPKLNDVSEEKIRQLIARHSANLVPYVPGSKVVHGKVVALSGSTGSAGSSILSLLLNRKDVAKIFLLNRRGGESQEIRQARGLKERGLDSTLLDTKKDILVYLTVDFSRKDLGISHEAYEELRDSVTHIIHAAWHLNFNLVLESYQRVHIAGVRHLVDLALSSSHTESPRFTFLSTISAAAMYQGQTQKPLIGDPAGQVLIPEEPINDPGLALDQGYGQSKYVCERVLVNAVDAGLRATIVRVGQLSGVTTNGAWAATEYVPIMLRSSISLGIVPEDLPFMRWIPSDVAASAIIKQAFHESTSALEYFSIENPFPTPWSVVVQALSAVSPHPLRQVTLAAWLEHIRKTNPDPREVPATKLLEFYEKRTQVRSTALAWEKSVALAPELSVGPISGGLVDKYVEYQQERIGHI